jgi:hypothetical protein
MEKEKFTEPENLEDARKRIKEMADFLRRKDSQRTNRKYWQLP